MQAEIKADTLGLFEPDLAKASVGK